MLHKILGEVIDHSELLNGEIQMILEGEFIWDEKKYRITNSLEWQIGNDVVIPILHSELLIENSSVTSQTIVGNYSTGNHFVDEETGELQFDLSYNIHAASSDEKIDCEITVQGNEWIGLLNINENQLV